MINGKTNARIKSSVSFIDFHILYSITCLIFRFLLDICLYYHSDFVESLLAFLVYQACYMSEKYDASIVDVLLAG